MPNTDSASYILQADLQGLKLLYDYTQFHIGVYLTLASAYITISSIKLGEHFSLRVRRWMMWIALGLFMLAGLAGGVIVSSLTQCFGLSSGHCTSTAAFLASDIGPWDWHLLWFRARSWTYIEHTSFWLGLLVAAWSFARNP